MTISSSSGDPDYFGTTLAAGDFDGDGNTGSLFGLGMLAVDMDSDGADDLAVAAPGEGSGSSVYFLTLQ